jgi:hypothetical protein
METMTDAVTDAAVQRASGRRPSRARSLLAAAVVGAGAAVMTYRLLRSGGEPDEEDT